jgi:hypothetical protein
MDGSLAGKRLQGRHIHPVSTYFAVTALPQWVYGMFSYDTAKTPTVRADLQSDPLGNKIVFLSRGYGPGPISQLWLLYEDYLRCVQIVNTLPMPLFPQESYASKISRITGALQVQFAGRGTFDVQR